MLIFTSSLLVVFDLTCYRSRIDILSNLEIFCHIININVFSRFYMYEDF